MRVIKLLLWGIALFIISACHDESLNIPRQSNAHVTDYFPLNQGQQWTYKITESDIDTSKIGFPKRFTVSVAGEVIKADMKYFLVVNYFVPGPMLPDTSFMRVVGNQVFVRFAPEQDEYLFYSFAPEDSMWSVPMYVNAGTTYPFYGSMTSSTEKFATMQWSLFKNPDRGESHWSEIFQQELGRVEIISTSQAFGRIVWKLENTQ